MPDSREPLGERMVFWLAAVLLLPLPKVEVLVVPVEISSRSKHSL